MVAVLRDDHPLAKRHFLDPEAVGSARLILTCCKFAAEGFGVAVCDPFSPTAFAHAHLCVRPWQPDVQLTYGILSPRRHETSPAQQALIDCLVAQVAQRPD